MSGRADVVYGSRFLGRHRVFLFTHYLGNRLLTLLTNVLYNTMLTDMETCYKVMRTEVLRSMTLQVRRLWHRARADGEDFQARYRVYEVPITYDGRGYEEGKKIRWRDGVVALWVLLQIPVHRVNAFLRLLGYARPYRGRLVGCDRRDDRLPARVGWRGGADPADSRPRAADARRSSD